MTSIRCSTRVSLFILSVAGSAAAQTEAAVAESLFREGKELMARQQYGDACPKFAESARLEPSSGAELALAICYEGDGKLASAWGAYTTAISLARRDGRQDRVEAATQGAAALEPRLTRLVVVVPPETAGLAGVEVHEDGVLLARAAWSGSPVDPGSHRLEVNAPDHVPFATTFTIESGAAARTITVPRLEERVSPTVTPVAPVPSVLPAPLPASQPPPAADAGRPNVLRTAEFAGTGVGVALLAAGFISGGIAISDANDVHKACPTTSCSNASAVSENRTAGTLADISTGALIAGGVLVTAGALMLWLAPNVNTTATPKAAHVHVDWAPGLLRGTF